MFGARMVGKKSVEISNLALCSMDTFRLYLDNTDSIILWAHELPLLSRFIDTETTDLRVNFSKKWDSYRQSNVVYVK